MVAFLYANNLFVFFSIFVFYKFLIAKFGNHMSFYTQMRIIENLQK